MQFGFHHVQARRRRTASGAEHQAMPPARRTFDTVMLVVGTLSPLALLPQVIALYATRDATGFSLITWMLLAAINMLWAIYGLIHKEVPIFIANAGMTLLGASIAVGIILFS